MKATVLSSGALLLILSGFGAAIPQQPSDGSTFEPLPTVAPPATLSTRPISLTPQASRTSTRAETTRLTTTETSVSQSGSATTSVKPAETTFLSSATAPAASSRTSSAAASASASHNAAPTQFGPWKAQGLAALGAITTVFASMLFVL